MKIICIGRNYAEHAKELKNDIPEKPVFFLKPETALIPNNHPFIYPDFTKDLHHEVELVLKINRLGKSIAEKHAHKYYQEIGIGIDFDEAVFNHVRRSLGDVVASLDSGDAAARGALMRLRQECVQAKEALSSDTDTAVPVSLPGLQTDVRLTSKEIREGLCSEPLELDRLRP